MSHERPNHRKTIVIITSIVANLAVAVFVPEARVTALVCAACMTYLALSIEF